MGTIKRVVIDYAPRSVFLPYHNSNKRWACITAHRRCGKTVATLNQLVKDALTAPFKNVRCAYVAPTYGQAKDVAWSYLKQYTANIPGTEYHESELRCDFINGARIRLYGAESYERMRGLGFYHVVMDEMANINPLAWTEVIRPALSDLAPHSKATFIGTPAGKNAFWSIYDNAVRSDDWLALCLKASETGILPPEEIHAAKSMMSPNSYAQEFECDFQAAIEGSYYGALMVDLENDGRLTNVPIDPHAQVHTAWDLGIGDSTAVIMFQTAGMEIRIVDAFEASGCGLDYYARELQRKQEEHGFVFGTHYFPHDVGVRELSTGRSRIESLRDLGIEPTIVPRLPIDDGISATRRLFPRFWIDEKLNHFCECIKQYRVEFDTKRKVYLLRPLHDWTSHFADALRMLSVGLNDNDQSWGGPLHYEDRQLV